MFGSGHTRSGLAGSASGQLNLKPGLAQLNGAAAQRLDKDTRAYLALCNPLPSEKWTKALNIFIIRLKNEGNWQLLDRLWIFAADNRQNARVSIRNPASAQITEYSSPAWTKDVGYMGNGSGMYLDTGYNAYTQGISYTLNSACFGVAYCDVAASEANQQNGIVVNPNVFMAINLSYSNYYGINSDSYTNVTPVPAPSDGLYVVQRTSSSNYALYFNGAQQGSASAASNAIPNGNFYLLARNGGSGANSFISQGIKMSFMGSGAINQQKLYACWQSFLNNL